VGEPRTLKEAFLAALPHTSSVPAPAGALVADPDLDAHLGRFVEAARAAWPDLASSAEPAAFVAHVARHLPEGSTAADLDALRAGDMWSAFAFLGRAWRAHDVLESRFLADVEGAVARMRLKGGTDDVKQTVRLQILVGDGVSPPRIAEYGGRGDLRAWLRVTAVRAALKVIRKERHEAVLEDEALADVAAPGNDPELGYIKEVYRATFREAFQEALDGLEDREKNILRQHVVDGVSIDQIGAMYDVHRATAARWLTKARENLLARTRACFMAKAKVSRGELDSILRLVQSQLDGTIRRRFERLP